MPFNFFRNRAHKRRAESHNDVAIENDSQRNDDKRSDKIADCSKSFRAPFPKPDFGNECTQIIAQSPSGKTNQHRSEKTNGHGHGKILPKPEFADELESSCVCFYAF